MYVEGGSGRTLYSGIEHISIYLFLPASHCCHTSVFIYYILVVHV